MNDIFSLIVTVAGAVVGLSECKGSRNTVYAILCAILTLICLAGAVISVINIQESL
jgi:hypothetical protein